MKAIKRPTLLVFIRHAESMRNEAKRGSIYFNDDEARRDVEGIPDHLIPLTETGLQQAALTGPALRRRFGAPDYLYHSGYKRAAQTAEGILAAYTAKEQAKIQVRQHIFIRERDPGYAYDMTKDEVARIFPFMDKYWKTFGGFFARPIGGESLAQVTERAYLFLNMLFRDRAGQKVFVVTHGGALRCFRFLLERWDYEQALHWPRGHRPKNCGLTVYCYDRKTGRLILQEYNTVCW
jgi:broad specificity phosphatase PhoE